MEDIFSDGQLKDEKDSEDVSMKMNQSLVEYKNVNKSFGDVTILSDLNLCVKKGEFLSLLGPSGCGKTTTLNILAGFLQCDSGEVYLRDQLVNNVPVHHRDLGMVFQRYTLFPHLNIFDNIAFGLRQIGRAHV